ncbi:PepSY domain-containing protein [Aquimonas voraii]|uniref:Peptidase propeptide and YPEB domain-containing protein n=1 Tax=Aquimonas voraii TaxID=265719 RepID=A0A1G6XY18_9GAMM|nr:hypothetical protein [Aquimonas voraii]SDD83098.1 hypothetical protein SAMN04488509_10833 [Aquimonas voraii]
MMSARLPLLLIALLLPCGSACASADSGEDIPELPPSEIRESVRRVEQETGGRVLRVEPVRRGGRDTYRMKVLTPEGRVRVMQDNRRDDRRSGGRGDVPGTFRDE